MPMLKKFPVLKLLICQLILHVASESNSQICKVQMINDMRSTNLPMITCASNQVSKLIYPSLIIKNHLIFKKGQIFQVSCPYVPDDNNEHISEPTFLTIGQQKKLSTKPFEIQCLENDLFKIDGQELSFQSLKCEKKYGPTLVKEQKICNSCTCYKIGYDLGRRNGQFLNVIEFCHDERRANTVWVKSSIRPKDLSQFTPQTDDKAYRKGILFQSIDMSARKGPYSLEKQFKVLENQLGNERVTIQYMDDDLCQRKYLAKGQLISYMDKLYSNEQEATFFYANTVPIWEKIRSGNWRHVEYCIRSLTNDKSWELEVWAGGIDNLQLENENIYLFHDIRLSWKIPVPKVLFKCLVNRLLEEGLCFLVVNNPYLSQYDNVPSDYIYCDMQDICKNIIHSYNSMELGFTYCCKLHDFHEGLKQRANIIIDGFEEIQSFDLLNFGN